MKIKEKLKSFLLKLHDPGIKFPMACDTQADIPSSTLFFTYMSFSLVFIGVVFLMQVNLLYGVIGAAGLYILSLVFYLMRRISVFRVDVNDGSLELNSENETNNNQKGKKRK